MGAPLPNIHNESICNVCLNRLGTKRDLIKLRARDIYEKDFSSFDASLGTRARQKMIDAITELRKCTDCIIYPNGFVAIWCEKHAQVIG